MPLILNQTPVDHIPDDFTLDSLTSAGLTPQEIKAITSGDDPMFDVPAAEAAPEAAQDIPHGDIGAPPQTPQPAAQPAAEAPAEQPPIPEIPQVPDVSAAKALVAQMDAALENLADAYDAGELTKAEFLTKQKDLIAQQTHAAREIERAAEIATYAQQVADTAKAQQEAFWNTRLEAYKAVAPELWAPEHLANWDAQLRFVTNSEGPYAELPRDEQIRLAHRFYAAAYETVTGKPLSGGAAVPSNQAGAQKPKQVELRTDPRPEPPRTLAGYNSDTSVEIEGSAFAVIDRLTDKDPLAAEREFARMTPEQQERYLRES